MSNYVIIGGGAGGAAAAARLRRLDEKSKIIIFERSGYVSSANCGLPYYIGDSIKDRDKLLVRRPEDFLSRFNIEVKTQWEVTEIDRNDRVVTAVNRQNGSAIKEPYDFCILSPGAEPVCPRLPGFDSDGIFTLRTIPDCDHIKKFVTENSMKSALVIGAGFIGLEMAENLYELGLDVSIVEMAEQILTPVDSEIASVIQFHLKCKNIRFYTGEKVVSIEKDKSDLKAILLSGKKMTADIIIMSVGVRPETKLAKDSGLDIGASGAIKVDAYMRTSDPLIYALGDAVETLHPVTKSYYPCYLAGPAAKQARVVANNIVRGDILKYRGSLGTAIAKVFDMTVARTGASETNLKKNGIKYNFIIDNPYQHAGYYPYPQLMFQKLLFCPVSGKLLGASAVGYDGIDKRIDIISSILGMNGTVEDLANFEQAYAPPFSSAKDPVNMLGFVAENIKDGLVKMATPEELFLSDKNDITIIDVRDKDEYELGYIEGAQNIPLDGLRGRLEEIPRNKTVYVYCEAGLRAYIACRMLLQNGFTDVSDLTGGYAVWQFFTQTSFFESVTHDDNWKKRCEEHFRNNCDDGIKKSTFDISGMDDSEIILCVKTGIAGIMEGDSLIFCSDNNIAMKKAVETVEKHEQKCRVTSDKNFFMAIMCKE